MIISIRRLDFQCSACELPAVFQVERTNDDLPDGYFKEGTRTEAYCNSHLPSHTRGIWERISSKD